MISFIGGKIYDYVVVVVVSPAFLKKCCYGLNIQKCLLGSFLFNFGAVRVLLCYLGAFDYDDIHDTYKEGIVVHAVDVVCFVFIIFC